LALGFLAASAAALFVTFSTELDELFLVAVGFAVFLVAGAALAAGLAADLAAGLAVGLRVFLAAGFLAAGLVAAAFLAAGLAGALLADLGMGFFATGLALDLPLALAGLAAGFFLLTVLTTSLPTLPRLVERSFHCSMLGHPALNRAILAM
jgi:hypothetical protein